MASRRQGVKEAALGQDKHKQDCTRVLPNEPLLKGKAASELRAECSLYKTNNTLPEKYLSILSQPQGNGSGEKGLKYYWRLSRTGNKHPSIQEASTSETDSADVIRPRHLCRGSKAGPERPANHSLETRADLAEAWTENSCTGGQSLRHTIKKFHMKLSQ